MADGGLAAQDAADGDLFALCATYADANAADLADKAIINLMALDAAGSWNVDHSLLLIGLNVSFMICRNCHVEMEHYGNSSIHLGYHVLFRSSALLLSALCWHLLWKLIGCVMWSQDGAEGLTI